MGGGATEEDEDRYHVFQYNTSQDEWSRLPPHRVIYFAMAQFTGSLITVGVGYQAVSLVRCITSKKNPRSGRSSSSPCQLQEVSSLLPPPSPPSLPLGGLLVSGMESLYAVPLWRCTAVKHLSGTLPTPCLHLMQSCLLSPSLAPATYWGELMLITTM